MEHKVRIGSALDVAVIGAGHAGLSISYLLKQHGLEHLVFERSRIGEAWRSQRWDTFAMNTMNKNNVLPGQTYEGNDPEGFGTAHEFVSSLEDYTLKHQLPVQEHTEVISVEKPDGDRYFTVSVFHKGNIINYQSKQVIITSGSQNEMKTPSFARNISADIQQLHTTEYRNKSQLQDGAVLVVGSAQSGCQIAEDLVDAGRKVYLSTSKVARIPRRYRGKDILDWLMMVKFFDLKTEAVSDPQVLAMKVPQLSGIGKHGHTISLQSIAKKGVTILGRMEDADDYNISFAANAPEHIKFADGFSQKAKSMVDEFILKNQLSSSPPEEDPADMPDSNASCASTITSLNLIKHNIGSVIWSTGFNGDFNYLKLPVFDSEGNPRHRDGLSDHKGLYFLGLPWLRMRKSSMIFGINDDAVFIAEAVANYHKTIN